MKGTPPQDGFDKSSNRSSYHGFTIVELLIAVVVIAILAAITIVAYKGITAQATDSRLKSELTTGAKQLQLAKVEDGSFPGSKPSYLGSTLQYTGGGDTFCITASKGSRAFHMTQAGSIQSGACSGHTVGGGTGGNEIAANSPIQNVTSEQCQALPTFTGSNSDAVRTVTDARGGTTRTYEIAKLADGKCWMLTNLKLGSTTGAITLTPADSAVASNFTLPKVATSSGEEYDLARVYGPAPGDTGSGSTNYGYLYNFAAATAGETRTSLVVGNAQSSICPAGWRLPTGGRSELQSDLIQLDIAFGGSGPYADNSEQNVSGWKFGGAFKGVYSGLYDPEYSALTGQGELAMLWSRSADPEWVDGVFGIDFGDSWSAPHSGGLRSVGAAVRCLLN